MIIEKHLMNEAAGLTLIGHRNDLTAFGVVAETGRVWHADELVVHHRLGKLERFRYDPAQRFGIRPVLDDEVFAVGEAVGAAWKRRVRQWHGERCRAHVVMSHRGELQIGRWRGSRAPV